jgi:hypothetical protein
MCSRFCTPFFKKAELYSDGLIATPNSKVKDYPLSPVHDCLIITDRPLHMPYANKQNKLSGQSPRANYTDRATAACQLS